MSTAVEKNLCVECNEPIVPVGNKRKNGKDHPDWSDRKYHKKCWKEVEMLNYYLTIEWLNDI